MKKLQNYVLRNSNNWMYSGEFGTHYMSASDYDVHQVVKVWMFIEEGVYFLGYYSETICETFELFGFEFYVS